MLVMRSHVSHPAIQLQSVSSRYRTALVGGRASEAPGPRPRIWWGRTSTSPAAEPGAAGRLARLEAVLFLAREPLASRKLAQLASLADGTEARTLMRKLNQQYDKAGRAFRIEEVAGGYHLLTRSKFAPWLRRLTGTGTGLRFSQPALETLAVVAYRQPVLRAEVESVRGVQCGEILRQLMERGMVRIVGRAEELGRPILYGTTRAFLETFGLKALEEMPRAEQLRRTYFEEVEVETSPAETGAEAAAELTAAETAVATATATDEVPREESVDYDEDEDEDEDFDEDDDFEDDDDEDEDDDDFEDEEWEEVEEDEPDEEELEEDLDDDLDDDDDWDDEEDEDWEDAEDDDWDEDED